MHFLRVRIRLISRVALASALTFFSAAFADQNIQDLNSQGSRTVDLSRLVVVGDSLSAGFQNFSLFDANSVSGLPPGGQTHGFASLIAQQASVQLPLPLISYPGIPPALILTPTGISRLSGNGQRENPTVQAKNLSVPGFAVADVLAHPFPGNPANAIDALSDVILGISSANLPGCGPIPTGSNSYIVSAVACAHALKPTTILVSLGNNDALQVLTFGVPPTDAVTFNLEYTVTLRALANTGATVVVANIPDVTAIPFLVPAPAFQAQCGFLPAGVTSSDFLVPNILNPTTNDMNLCSNYAVRSAALIAQAQQAVQSYNQIIATTAKSLGATVVDVNGLFANIAANGYQVGNVRLTSAFLGGLFSLDGIHPTNTGYAILANQWISTMNSKLNTSIPSVSVDQVAQTDPLILH